MSTPSVTERLAAFSAALYKRIGEALNESGFRRDFLADPRAAYRARVGHDLLPGERIEVRAMANGGWCFCVPDLQFGMALDRDGRPMADDSLSDELLEVVSGGACVGPTGSPKPT